MVELTLMFRVQVPTPRRVTVPPLVIEQVDVVAEPKSVTPELLVAES